MYNFAHRIIRCYSRHVDILGIENNIPAIEHGIESYSNTILFLNCSLERYAV